MEAEVCVGSHQAFNVGLSQPVSLLVVHPRLDGPAVLAACKSSYTGPIPPQPGSPPSSTATAPAEASHNTTFSEVTTQWSGPSGVLELEAEVEPGASHPNPNPNPTRGQVLLHGPSEAHPSVLCRATFSRRAVGGPPQVPLQALGRRVRCELCGTQHASARVHALGGSLE